MDDPKSAPPFSEIVLDQIKKIREQLDSGRDELRSNAISMARSEMLNRIFGPSPDLMGMDMDLGTGMDVGTEMDSVFGEPSWQGAGQGGVYLNENGEEVDMAQQAASGSSGGRRGAVGDQDSFWRGLMQSGLAQRVI